MDDGDYIRLACLARAARDGDIQAYGRIVELTRAAVESAARLIVHDPQDAEEVAQETYLRAYQGLDGLQDPGSLLAWLQRIARNLALNRRRAIQGVFVRDVDVTEIPEPDAEADERRPALAQAMVTLVTDDRRLAVLRLCHHIGASHS